MLLIHGKPGFGKTALVEAFSRIHAGAPSASPRDPVRIFTANESQGLTELGPLVHLLRSLGHDVVGDAATVYRRLVEVLPPVIVIDDLDHFDDAALAMLRDVLIERSNGTRGSAVILTASTQVALNVGHALHVRHETIELRELTESEWIKVFGAVCGTSQQLQGAIRKAHAAHNGDPSTLFRILHELDGGTGRLTATDVERAASTAGLARAKQLVGALEPTSAERELIMVLSLLPEGVATLPVVEAVLGLTEARVERFCDDQPGLVSIVGDAAGGASTMMLGAFLHGHHDDIAELDVADAARIRARIVSAMRVSLPLIAAQQLEQMTFTQVDENEDCLNFDLIDLIESAAGGAKPEHAERMLGWAVNYHRDGQRMFELTLRLAAAQYECGRHASAIATFRTAPALDAAQHVSKTLAITERLTLEGQFEDAARELRKALDETDETTDEDARRDLACGLAAHSHDSQALRQAADILRPSDGGLARPPRQYVACARLALQPPDPSADTAAAYAERALEAGFLGTAADGERTLFEVLTPVWILICAEEFGAAERWLKRAGDTFEPLETFLPVISAFGALIAIEDARTRDAAALLATIDSTSVAGPAHHRNVLAWWLAARLELDLMSGRFSAAEEAVAPHHNVFGRGAPSSLRASAAAARTIAMRDAQTALDLLEGVAGRDQEPTWRPGIPYMPVLTRLRWLAGASSSESAAALHYARAAQFQAPRQLADAACAILDVSARDPGVQSWHRSQYRDAVELLDAKRCLDSRAGIALRLFHGPPEHRAAAARAAAEAGAGGLLVETMIRSGRGHQSAERMMGKAECVENRFLRRALWIESGLPDDRWSVITGLADRTTKNYTRHARDWMASASAAPPVRYLDALATVATAPAVVAAIAKP